MRALNKAGFVGVILFLLFVSFNTAQAIVITYEATDLADTTAGEDLWQFTYTVSDHTFAADTGFTIFFDLGLYDLLNPFPLAPNGDWDVLAWDPDPSIPDDGAYDAYAYTDNASLSDSFTVNFVWLGTGTPMTQYFEVYDGLTWEVLESGDTTAAPVPEPATLLLFVTGLAGLTGWCKKRIV